MNHLRKVVIQNILSYFATFRAYMFDQLFAQKLNQTDEQRQNGLKEEANTNSKKRKRELKSAKAEKKKLKFSSRGAKPLSKKINGSGDPRSKAHKNENTSNDKTDANIECQTMDPGEATVTKTDHSNEINKPKSHEHALFKINQRVPENWIGCPEYGDLINELLLPVKSPLHRNFSKKIIAANGKLWRVCDLLKLQERFNKQVNIITLDALLNVYLDRHGDRFESI